MGGRIGSSVAGWFLQSVVRMLAAVMWLLFSVGPRRPGAGGKVDESLCAHTAYRNTRTGNVSGGKTAKGQHGPHILVVLRMTDLCAQGEQE